MVGLRVRLALMTRLELREGEPEEGKDLSMVPSPPRQAPVLTLDLATLATLADFSHGTVALHYTGLTGHTNKKKRYSFNYNFDETLYILAQEIV